MPRVTWPPVIGLRADSGGRRGPRGGLLRSSWWHGSLRLARRPTGGGRVLRGSRLRCRCRRGYLWLAGGLTQAAGAGYETSGPFEPFFFLGLALALSPAAGAVRPAVLDRFTRTGSEDGGGLALAPCPLMGAVRPVGRDRFTRTR